ncbi:MAG TPA: hypothetical protein VF530_16130 [Planctomycetota bacterium]
MNAQSPLAARLLAALFLLTPLASAQFTVTTNKTTYAVGEAVVIGEKMVNATLLPLSYSTVAEDGSYATIQYQIARVDPENRATLRPAFELQRNGHVLRARTLRIHATSSGYSGQLGPGRSFGLGGSVGFGVPLNLLQVPPATSGVDVYVVTEDNREVLLTPGERIALLTPGAYQLTALVDGIEISGYRYSRSVTGFLVAETFFDVTTHVCGGPTGQVRVP